MKNQISKRFTHINLIIVLHSIGFRVKYFQNILNYGILLIAIKSTNNLKNQKKDNDTYHTKPKYVEQKTKKEFSKDKVPVHLTKWN